MVTSGNTKILLMLDSTSREYFARLTAVVPLFSISIQSGASPVLLNSVEPFSDMISLRRTLLCAASPEAALPPGSALPCRR